MTACILPALMLTVLGAGAAAGQAPDVSDLAVLTPGRTLAENALWGENPPDRRFGSSRRVVIADLKGPGVISMIHLAMPQSHFVQPPIMLNRDVLLKMYWDGETSPSVDCPVVDFFCDPAGLRETLETVLMNKKRGYNAYLPMPFRESARIELVYDGPVEPGAKLWSMMPCYSYVNFSRFSGLL